jgi:hypothetical protein
VDVLSYFGETETKGPHMMSIRQLTSLNLLLASLATGFVTATSPGTAAAQDCTPGMAMNSLGECVAAQTDDGANTQYPPEYVQALGGDPTDPDSPVVICQDPSPCAEHESVLESTCGCPPR